MKLQFQSNQQYQLEAIKAVVDVFEGQPTQGNDLELEMAPPTGQLKIDGSLVIGNMRTLDDEAVLANVRRVQGAFNEAHEMKNKETKELFGGVEVSEKLQGMDFSVEMETGTGKTYVYLRTIHELHKTYGFKKFVIVVPGIAIKEGVLKNLEITKEHFALLYNNPKIDFYVYDPKRRGQLKTFATTSALQVLVINIDSFSKDLPENFIDTPQKKKATNIIYQDSDYGKPIEYLKATNPIVIVDEPQNMETDIRKKAIKNLNPLCTLRYSATHKNPYNLLHKLDPVRAYDLGLVKKIEVDSILSEDAYSEAYIHPLKIVKLGKSKLAVQIEIDKSDEAGLQKKIVTLEPGGDLFKSSGEREAYKDFTLDSIDAKEDRIEFTNGKVYAIGQRDAGLREQIAKYQIQKTVEDHFEKEAKLKDKGIKVLSLFFIDKVANYREYRQGGAGKGKFALWFEEAYRAMQAKPRFKDVLEYGAEQVHNGYFAQDKDGTWKDSKDAKGEGAKTQDDDRAYELIMKNKEKLLDPNVPLRFIFSHSALREGWDNPNVFQICTLNETKSDIKKRQEIGRGMRLPVNERGERVFDQTINVLTVIANESYEEFAGALQKEIEEDCGVKFTGRIVDKRKRRPLKLRKNYQLDKNFIDLWERIKQKTKYQVQYKAHDLTLQAANLLQTVEIKRPKITSLKATLAVNEKGVQAQSGVAKAVFLDNGRGLEAMPDALGGIQRKTKLTKATICQILKLSGKLDDVRVNPQQLIDETVIAIGKALHGLMVDGIKYEKLAGEFFEMRLFENKDPEGYLNKLHEVQKPEKTLYDYVPYDSGVESDFARDLEAREDVKFYVKLPGWFNIKTPIGTYNPDWAIVFENDKRVYFVAETKKWAEIRESEDFKIMCGKRHFGVLDGVCFERVGKLEEIIL